jgi:hypothetical protein
MRIKGLRVFPVLVLMGTVLCCLAGNAFADYTVTGSFSYVHRDQDYRTGFTGTTTPRPVRFADIEVWSSTGTAPTLLLSTARVATDQNGNFSIVVPGSTQQKIQVLCYATATATLGLNLEVRRNSNQYTTFADPTGAIVSYSSQAFQYLSGTSLAIGNIQIPATEQEFNIWDALVNAAQFVQSVTGSYPTSTILGVWSSGLLNYRSYYASPSGISSLTKKYFFIGNGYDDSVIYHQIGHFITDAYSKLDAPDLSSAGFLPSYGDGNQDIRIAWAEGAAIFLGASIRQFKGDTQAPNYLVTDGTNAVVSFEIQSLTQPVYPAGSVNVNSPLASSKGSTNMLAVASVLWNITNGTSLQRPFPDVWSVLTAMPSSTSSGFSLEWFWDTWFTTFTTNGSPDAMNAVFSARGIEYFADAQEPDNAASTAPTVAVAQLPLASGPKVVLNEILIASVNGIELFNVGDTTADLLGWTVVTSRSGQPDSIFTLPPFLLKPGSFVVLAGMTGLNTNSVIYAGTTFPWIYGGNDGACEIYDASLTAKDFVRWGSSTAIPHSPWTGTNPAVPAAGMSLGRTFAGADTNSGTDWTAQVPTMGTFNLSGLEKHHTFYPVGDVDYIAFSAVSGRTYAIETLNLTNGADTVLDLLATDGTTVLATNDDTLGFTLASRIQWKAPSSGTYFVRCSRYTGPTNLAHYGSYDLRISESASALGVPQPNILTVSNQGAGGKYSTLASAVSAAANGDTVQIIDSGTYAENLNIFGKSITINVAAGQSPILDGKTASMAIVLSNLKNIRLDSLKILHGTFGIYVNNANATLVNCVIARATTDGVYVVGSTSLATVVNSTIENNGRYGLTVVASGTVRVANSIIRDSKGGPDIEGDTNTPSLTITNSLIGIQPICNPPTPCGWNFIGRNNNPSGNPNPQFANATLDDYRLLPASPLIDKGDPNDAALPATDAAGAPRSMAGTGTTAIPDMGAFEYYSAANLTSLEVFPQMAVGFTSPQGGEEYRTTLVGINASAVPAIINVVLDDNSGFPLSVSGTTQIGIPFVIGSGGISRLETTATAAGAALVSGYVKFQSSSALNGSALFKVLNGSSIVSEAGVGLSKPTTAFTVYVDDVNNAWSGYAIANTGSADANLTLTLRDQNGNVVAGPVSLMVKQGNHMAEFAWQRFTNIPANFVGSIYVTSDQNVEAVALRYDNMNLDTSLQVFSTIPVLIDEVATSLYFPQAADGGGYRSNLILVNPNTAAASAKLEFFDDNGNPVAFSIGGSSQTSVTVNVSGKGVARIATDGIAPSVSVAWVKVTSSQPIGGSAIFQTVTTLNQITSEAGVASSAAASHVVSYAFSSKDAVLGPTAASGLAICNPGSTRANVTLQLRDTFGNVAAARQFVLPVNGHVAGFFSGANQWFPTGFDNFEGTLEVIADQPVSAVALRYDNLGLTVFATIPVIIVP